MSEKQGYITLTEDGIDKAIKEIKSKERLEKLKEETKNNAVYYTIYTSYKDKNGKYRLGEQRIQNGTIRTIKEFEELPDPAPNLSEKFKKSVNDFIKVIKRDITNILNERKRRKNVRKKSVVDLDTEAEKKSYELAKQIQEQSESKQGYTPSN